MLLNKKPIMEVDINKKSFFFGTSPDLPKIVEIELHLISPNPDQPRKTFNEEGLRELATSIDRQGLIQPIVVKKISESEGYTLVAGERRYRAHQILARETIASIVTKGNADEIAVIENLQREDLNPIEEAEALARLMDRYNYSQEELGKVIGKAQETVSNLLRLNSLPAVIKQEYPTTNTVSKWLLIEIVRLPSEEEQIAIWEQVKQGNTTVRSIREAKKQGTTPKKHISPAAQMLVAGRNFTKKLAQVSPQDLHDNRDQLVELLELHQQINDLVRTLQTVHSGSEEEEWRE